MVLIRPYKYQDHLQLNDTFHWNQHVPLYCTMQPFLAMVEQQLQNYINLIISSIEYAYEFVYTYEISGTHSFFILRK